VLTSFAWISIRSSRRAFLMGFGVGATLPTATRACSTGWRRGSAARAGHHARVLAPGNALTRTGCLADGGRDVARFVRRHRPRGISSGSPRGTGISATIRTSIRRLPRRNWRCFPSAATKARRPQRPSPPQGTASSRVVLSVAQGLYLRTGLLDQPLTVSTLLLPRVRCWRLDLRRD